MLVRVIPVGAGRHVARDPDDDRHGAVRRYDAQDVVRDAGGRRVEAVEVDVRRLVELVAEAQDDAVARAQALAFEVAAQLERDLVTGVGACASEARFG